MHLSSAFVSNSGAKEKALTRCSTDDRWYRLRLILLNRLQKKPLEICRGIPLFLQGSRHTSHDVVAALP